MKTITVTEKHIARKKVGEFKKLLKKHSFNMKWGVEYVNHDTRFITVKNNETE
jgi:hypothetical protein